jgi:hypothetical protein
MFDDQNFIEYLKKHKPYLYDIELQVMRLRESTGYGDISVAISMTQSVVDRGEILTTVKRLYYKRKNNQLVKNIDSDGIGVSE